MSRNFNYSGSSEDGQAVDQIISEVKSLIEPAVKMQDTVKELESQQSAIVTDIKKLMDHMNGGELKGANNDPSLAHQIAGMIPELKAHKRSRIEVKNTILGESGSPANPTRILNPADRLPGVVPGAFRALNILDVIPTGRTSSNLIEYTRDSAWTNNAAEAAEGTQKQESDLTFALVSEPVRTVAHFLKISRQALDDAPAVAAYIDTRMRHGLLTKLQSQILNGAGSAQIAGLAAVGRHTAFTPATANALDSIGECIDLMRSDDFQPGAIFLHPNDYGQILRAKKGEDNGYLLDGGRDIFGPLPGLWGIPVATNPSVAEGKFYVIDPSQLMLFSRQEATVELFEQDSTNVQYNLVTVRAELRAALAVFNILAVRFGDLVGDLET
jgi:HK97 family phage major capsid protein